MKLKGSQKAGKKKGNERWHGRIVANDKKRCKLLQKEINNVQKKREEVITDVKTMNENVVQYDSKVKEIWREHFREGISKCQKSRRGRRKTTNKIRK